MDTGTTWAETLQGVSMREKGSVWTCWALVVKEPPPKIDFLDHLQFWGRAE